MRTLTVVAPMTIGLLPGGLTGELGQFGARLGDLGLQFGETGRHVGVFGLQAFHLVVLASVDLLANTLAVLRDQCWHLAGVAIGLHMN